ncbi:DUF1064 domain-containing protein [Lysinibacillus mangiferihumi]|uniref:DUF1064 domain-containing protein n=1 Tax=Lysinibacillus mangiferihumi TaxID=1130819 RepID=A0A4U2Z0B7_9BACI|nr:DUF1064 domain-containing protein [Lysinibacillus mangiferihumi]TKI66642.1 DUF1064 domain-containing protein [Lysinibacillus mangiferihumi]
MGKAKYGNKKVVHDGITFDSAIEARYYDHLKNLQAQGVVTAFELQPRFVLLPKFEKNGKKYREIGYNADFTVHYADGRTEVVDIKGMVTQQFELRKKLFEYRYPHELKLLTYSKIDSGWITHDELKKARKARKEAKAG